jgi:hypothetical protein
VLLPNLVSLPPHSTQKLKPWRSTNTGSRRS